MLSSHDAYGAMLIVLVTVTCGLGLFVLWVLSLLTKAKVEAATLGADLGEANGIIAYQRKLLLEPSLYKAITHRYNNVRGGDRFQCMKLKEELQRLRNEQ